MKALILAAGKGSRIAKHISFEHKSLLPLPIAQEKIPLLLYTINKLKQYDINNISIVTGYRHEDIEEIIISTRVKIFYNPFYELVNSIGSLWFCHEQIKNDDDILIINADTFLEESLIRDIAQNPVDHDHPLLLVDSSKAAESDVKVTYKNNILEKYGKEIDVPAMAESVDIAILPKSAISDFRFHLQTMLEKKHFDTWWESVLVQYLENYPVYIKDIKGQFWSEIDFYEDYLNICKFCKGEPL